MQYVSLNVEACVYFMLSVIGSVCNTLELFAV